MSNEKSHKHQEEEHQGEHTHKHTVHSPHEHHEPEVVDHVHLDADGNPLWPKPHGQNDAAHPHIHGGVADYNFAINEYKKTFPTPEQQIEQTPDPAVRELLLNMQELGLETTFDRFEKQKPHCNFGMAGICCKNCFMGPCRITKKATKGACGADADVVVARNLLRHLASGAASHGARGRESMLALKYAAEGKVNLEIEGENKIRSAAAAYHLDTEGKTTKQLAGEIADILLEDWGRSVPAKHKTIESFAPPERKKRWAELGIIPISTTHEVVESLHRTSPGTDSDWQSIMHQFLRMGVAFAQSSCLGTGIAQDCLYGLPRLSTSKTNVGALKKGWVNIAVHGHSPLVVRAVVKLGHSEEMQQLARKAGAEGIQFYGICCSGLSAMYRYEHVIPLSNAVGAELVLGTGALDLWVADVQDVFPTIMDVARCFKTVVVTTSDSARLKGAEHYALNHEHSNLDEIEQIARKIVLRAIEAHKERQDVPVKIPQYEVEAQMGFSLENVNKIFGSLDPVAQAIKEGKILGLVNLVGCSNPRKIYEKGIIEVAQVLLENNVLIMTNGCASFPLLKLGYCNTNALQHTGEGLRSFLKPYNIPPVWHMGECLDNARASAMFGSLSGKLRNPIKDLPFAFCSPEWSNEKGMCAALAFRLLGMNSYHSVYAPIQGSQNVEEFMLHGTKPLLGSEMITNVDSTALAHQLVADLKSKREQLGWPVIE